MLSFRAGNVTLLNFTKLSFLLPHSLLPFWPADSLCPVPWSFPPPCHGFKHINFPLSRTFFLFLCLRPTHPSDLSLNFIRKAFKTFVKTVLIITENSTTQDWIVIVDMLAAIDSWMFLSRLCCFIYLILRILKPEGRILSNHGPQTALG